MGRGRAAKTVPGGHSQRLASAEEQSRAHQTPHRRDQAGSAIRMTEAETRDAFLPNVPPLRAMAAHIDKGLEYLSDADFWQEFREAWLQHDRLNEFQPEIRALLVPERINAGR